MSVANNPINTEQQRQHERYAVELFNTPELIKVRQQVHDYWLDLAKPSAVAASCFDAAFEEVMFAAVIWALNQDPLYPKVITITRLAHALDEIQIPGSRWGIDNPDSVYRVIPISGDHRYQIHGRVAKRRLLENYFTLWDKDMRTVGLLSGKDLVVDADGFFTITVDADEAGSRPNHIQTDHTAHEFYIRDVIADWQLDRPNELRVERVGAAEREPRSRQQDIQLASEYMQKWATNTTRWNNQAMNRAPNDFSFTIDRDTDGALRNQVYIMGHFVLPSHDHVIVLDIDMGGAEYFIAPITNLWGTSNEIVERNGCLNQAQSIANADGSYQFVLALHDPGVANWLDPSDMTEGILTLRWAEFVNDQAGESLGVKSRLLTITEFNNERAGQPVFTLEQRQQQLVARAASYQWRLA
ncbi:hypothetical protein [Oceanicoccus sp. KOV_DT_Chl]|uniref:hypothetical protein n=1 Tax=Oceanicoccus sp. KOV_DT_Chl TaxID=1904639 RepID=UPI000C7E5DEA|nr:hypothetical protein [Oceanicoccus sp. KOV_DT_Chl]